MNSVVIQQIVIPVSDENNRHFTSSIFLEICGYFSPVDTTAVMDRISIEVKERHRDEKAVTDPDPDLQGAKSKLLKPHAKTSSVCGSKKIQNLAITTFL